MKFPWYLRLYSYFRDIHLEEINSQFSDTLKVSLSNDRLKLSAGAAVYSEEDNYYNYTEIFKVLKIKDKNFNKVLVLGLGLGSIPVMLENKFKKFYQYDLVDIDPAIVQLFQKYVYPDLKSKHSVIQTDALEFVKSCSCKYDLICIDLFINRHIPDQFIRMDFIQNLRNIMMDNGIIIYNRIEPESKEEIEQTQNFETNFQTYFPTYKKYRIVHNKMYVGEKI